MHLTVMGSNAAALVDDCWADLARYRWRLDKDGYVMRKCHGHRIYLHHVVLPGNRYPAYVRDHISRDKLDNRTSNLRWLTLQESAQNKGHQRRNVVGVRGVTRYGPSFRAVASVGGTRHNLGTFATIEQANAVVSAWRNENMPYAA